MPRSALLAVPVLLCSGLAVAQASPNYYTGFPYLDRSDTLLDVDSPDYTLETFEDGISDIIGVSHSTGFLQFPSPTTDSVDGDDGAVDGSGVGGHSFLIPSAEQGVTFTFHAAELGGLPTEVGLVWTDGPTGAAVRIEVFDHEGQRYDVGSGTSPVGDADELGGTAEDLLFAVTGEVPIGAVRLFSELPPGTLDGPMEIDHFQFAEVTSWVDLGGGVEGALETPYLVGTGALEAGARAELRVEYGLLSGASGLLVVGLSQADLPFLGGVLVPAPDLVLPGLVSDEQGCWNTSFRWPESLPAGTQVYFQTWFEDPSAIAGVSGSNATAAIVY